MKFHIPTIKEFKHHGWTVDVACAGETVIPYCDQQFNTVWKRTPFTMATLKGIVQLREIINQRTYDVIYCHTPVGGFIARLAARKARKTGTKVIYCAHGFHFYQGAPIRNWLIYYPIEKLLGYVTDSVITLNDEDYSIVSRKFKSISDVNHVPGIGVNFQRLRVEDPIDVRHRYRKDLGIPEDATVLIYVAEIIKNKNQCLLVDTLKVLSEKRDDIYLLLVGPDYSNGNCQLKADRLGLTDRVRILGWRDDIGELMHTADICVASSLREGFGINLVEAMYCGLPVVASDNRGHKTIIEHGVNGYIAASNKPEEIAYYLEKLIDDPELYESMTDFDVSQYDMNTIARKIYKIIAA